MHPVELFKLKSQPLDLLHHSTVCADRRDWAIQFIRQGDEHFDWLLAGSEIRVIQQSKESRTHLAQLICSVQHTVSCSPASVAVEWDFEGGSDPALYL
jgi:hypothetical protein